MPTKSVARGERRERRSETPERHVREREHGERQHRGERGAAAELLDAVDRKAAVEDLLAASTDADREHQCPGGESVELRQPALESARAEATQGCVGGRTEHAHEEQRQQHAEVERAPAQRTEAQVRRGPAEPFQADPGHCRAQRHQRPLRSEVLAERFRSASAAPLADRCEQQRPQDRERDPEGNHLGFTSGGFHFPEMSSGFGQYVRSTGQKAPAGAGSQFDSSFFPGDSCCR